ncbi:MAG TPA: mandelate racemase/muconate lactonizing enzyme family protein [Thermomicrobiales bacterium]|nr:mandelate racemase/muconate lactonizing enzyme family protein [Thermomicrobiales bacterium]
MKITRVDVEFTSVAKERPIRDALQVLDRNGNCRLTIQTDEGVTGQSDTYFGRVAASPGILAQILREELAPAIVGEDPFLIRGIRDKLWALTDYHGTAGYALFGIAAIDLALWDLVGKAVGQPVWRILGPQRTAVPTYAMVGWLELDRDGLTRVCTKAMEQGFQGVKMKVGAATLAEDVARIETVRAAIGPDAALMVDANQVFTVMEATRRGLVYQEMGCTWFEEPIRADDTDGHVQLAQRLQIPIATGENLYGQAQFRDLFVRGGVGIVQPDLRRAGGLTECLEIGLMAKGFNIPYASHGGGPHLHLLAALPNTIYMESGLLPEASPFALVDGCYPLPEEPGLATWR